MSQGRGEGGFQHAVLPRPGWRKQGRTAFRDHGAILAHRCHGTKTNGVLQPPPEAERDRSEAGRDVVARVGRPGRGGVVWASRCWWPALSG